MMERVEEGCAGRQGLKPRLFVGLNVAARAATHKDGMAEDEYRFSQNRLQGIVASFRG
jgi:hypothetical protein